MALELLGWPDYLRATASSMRYAGDEMSGSTLCWNYKPPLRKMSILLQHSSSPSPCLPTHASEEIYFTEGTCSRLAHGVKVMENEHLVAALQVLKVGICHPFISCNNTYSFEKKKIQSWSRNSLSHLHFSFNGNDASKTNDNYPVMEETHFLFSLLLFWRNYLVRSQDDALRDYTEDGDAAMMMKFSFYLGV